MHPVRMSCPRPTAGKRSQTKEVVVRRIGYWSVLFLLAINHSAGAQSRLFASANVVADVQRLSGDFSSNPDTKFGGGAGLGVLVNDRWDVRTEAEVGGASTQMQPLL